VPVRKHALLAPCAGFLCEPGAPSASGGVLPITCIMPTVNIFASTMQLLMFSMQDSGLEPAQLLRRASVRQQLTVRQVPAWTDGSRPIVAGHNGYGLWWPRWCHDDIPLVGHIPTRGMSPMCHPVHMTIGRRTPSRTGTTPLAGAKGMALPIATESSYLASHLMHKSRLFVRSMRRARPYDILISPRHRGMRACAIAAHAAGPVLPTPTQRNTIRGSQRARRTSAAIKNSSSTCEDNPVAARKSGRHRLHAGYEPASSPQRRPR
jgi:hypothetical protein